MGRINSNMVSQAVILLALAALQYSLAVPTTISDVVPETRFVEHGDVAEGLLCSDAQPQAPRDLTTGASGAKRALGPLNLVPGHADATADGFVHVNTHFHEGAEHKSDAYNTAPPSEGPNGGEYQTGTQAGNVPTVLKSTTNQACGPLTNSSTARMCMLATPTRSTMFMELEDQRTQLIQ